MSNRAKEIYRKRKYGNKEEERLTQRAIHTEREIEKDRIDKRNDSYDL